MVELHLRPWLMDDAQSMAAGGGDPAVARNMTDSFPAPFTVDAARAMLERFIADDGHGQCCRAIEVEGRVAGSIGAFFGHDIYRKSADIAYWLAVPYWGKGLMTKAVESFCTELFGTFDLERIQAMPFARNAGSRRVLEKAGFLLEGICKSSVFKDGQLLDSCIYARLKSTTIKFNLSLR